MSKIIRALTIAGSDASGGAGMAADINTFEEFGLYGQVVLTTVVTMEPSTWEHRVHELPLDLFKAQMDTVLAGETPIGVLKTGMLGTPAIVRAVAETIAAHPFPKVVIDPVLVCKGTDEVLNPDTADAIREHLLPVATVVTPNLFEAGALARMSPLRTIGEMKEAARIIHELGAEHVVIKGGKALPGETALDLFYDGREFILMEAEKIIPAYHHGAGCTFAAAVAAGLAKGETAEAAVRTAKDYVHAAIKGGFAYNAFVGPVFRPAYRLERQGNF
jgi:pyridoxine kinase